MTDHEDLREEMQYYENEHYNELRKLEAEEETAPTLKADRDAWKARAEIAEAELKEAVEDLKMVAVHNNSCAFCIDNHCCSMQGPDRKSVEHCWQWRGARKEGEK